ncbi:MAG: transcriptional repressor [Planctomycetes bacterium]|nr:transcriptional repressor [Planctomycetota bacterium]
MDPAERGAVSERFARLCRERGLARTVQRRAILGIIAERTDHPSADQVFEAARERLSGVSRTTVYRVLEMLADLGVITKACSPGSATRFDPMTRRHHHLVCLRCERLVDIVDERLGRGVELPAEQARSFLVHDFSIHFHGICAACRRKARAPQKGSVAASSSARKHGSRRHKAMKKEQRRKR